MSYTAVATGQVTAADTNEATIPNLPSASRVILKAMKANVGNIYIGATGLTSTTGFELAPGEAVAVELIVAAKVKFRAASAGDKLCWIATS